jgi:hypothetical protein
MTRQRHIFSLATEDSQCKHVYMTTTKRLHKAKLLTTKILATTLEKKQAHYPPTNLGDVFKLKY